MVIKMKGKHSIWSKFFPKLIFHSSFSPNLTTPLASFGSNHLVMALDTTVQIEFNVKVFPWL